MNTRPNTLIIATTFEDPDRQFMLTSMLENTTGEKALENVWEIDTADWEEDAWYEWDERFQRFMDDIEMDEDTVVIWKITNGSVERETFGY